MSSHRFQAVSRLLGLILVIGWLGGCEEDSVLKVIDPEGPEPYPAATTENQLIQNFLDAYNDRNLPEYDRLLHEDFEFHFADEDVDPVQNIPLFWDRQQDLAATEKMFNGSPGRLDDDGSQQSPVQSITLSLLPRNVWSSEGIPGEFEAEMWREYDVVMAVHYDNGDIAQVTGYQRFYVARVPAGADTVWKLRLWRDTGQHPG